MTDSTEQTTGVRRDAADAQGGTDARARGSERASAPDDPRASASDDPRARVHEAAGIGGRGGRRAQSAQTLSTVVETVRRITRADTASVISFSAAERTVTWHARSGFRAGGAGELVTPLGGATAERVVASGELTILEGLGREGGPPAAEFPVHAAEGVETVALAPLRARGETLGALVVGYRSPHDFTAEERETLSGLAEMAALALDNARLLETVGAGKRIWEQTFDAIPDGIIVHDARMIITRLNAAAAEMLGLDSPSEAVGLSRAAAFARLFGERAAAYHMAGDTPSASSFEIQAEDGRRYLVAVAPIMGGGGQGLGVGEEELSDERFEGRPDEQFEGQFERRPDEQFEGQFERQPDEQSSRGTRAARPPSDPDPHPPSPIPQPPSPNPRASWSVITWSDVTQLSEMQEQLARSRRLATVGQLAAGVAHEINNPLAAVTTCAEAIQRDLRTAAELAAAAEERGWNFYLEEIVRQALRCKSITRGLLDLARQRRARREPCDLNALAARTAKLFSERAAAGSRAAVEVGLSLDGAVGEVATDEGLVRQILDNLLTNALDALDGAGAGGTVRVSTALVGERVRLEVEDTGPGIAPETISRIFEPFFTTKEAGKGSGLGLTIASTLAEALGGALTVESKLGAGSRFRLWLPRRAPDKG
jgi:signal transduction histidine kinase/PAS domain-containing protein